MIFRSYFNDHTSSAPLAVFRLFFGFIMFVSILRFWLNGWIDKLYIQPSFFFSYYGFGWVTPLGKYTYVIFIICAIAALMIMLGIKYRYSIIIFFISFTYIELMDKTTYLNHYYFISVLSFLMIFLPAGTYYSMDDRKQISYQYIPRWYIDSVKFLISIVYFYAGLSKINSDWMVDALPLKIWLSSQYDFPIIGHFLSQQWTPYLLSWSGAIYDLCIPFLLIIKKTRIFAFTLVIGFHLMTGMLFPIGMFPYIMIASTTIFFDYSIHNKILSLISTLIKISKYSFDSGLTWIETKYSQKIKIKLFSLFFLVQLLFPWRYLFYPGELFWTEEGYRFSWRVMLTEKIGYTRFKIVSHFTGKIFYVDNANFLTPFQEKQMSFQPDFILEYAHYLSQHYASKGYGTVKIYAESYVSLNGRRSQPYIDPTVDLTEQAESCIAKSWILPFNDDIKGF